MIHPRLLVALPLALLLLLLLPVASLARADDAKEKPQERVLQHGSTRVVLSAGLTEDQAAPVIVLAGATKATADGVLLQLGRTNLRYVVIATGAPGPFPSHMDYDGLVRTWAASALQWTSLSHRAVLKSAWIVYGRGELGLSAARLTAKSPGRYQAVVLADSAVPKADQARLDAAADLQVIPIKSKGKASAQAIAELVQQHQDTEVAARWFDHQAASSKAVTFPAADGLEIRADYYPRRSKQAPVVVLFHQARSSRGEYSDIARRLMLMGYTCLAIDQRSGGGWGGIRNETAARAKKSKKPQGYIDARPDLDAAIAWIRAQGHKGKLAIVGSSYSSSLAIFVGADNEEVSALVSFSPGDYLPPRGSIFEAARRLEKPVLIVCPPREKRQATQVFDAVASKAKALYVQPRGIHGASTLNRSPTAAAAWTCFTDFLAAHTR